MTEGYVKLHRALLEHPIFTQLSPSVLKVWIACLARANWKPSKWYDGQKQIDIPAGAFISSQQTLGKLCRLSRKEVRTALLHLQNLKCVAIRGASRYSLLVIENWSTYQADETNGGQDSGRVGARQGPDRGHERATEEEYKKGRIHTPKPPKGALAAIPSDPDKLPFATILDPVPDEALNGNNGYSAGAKNGNGHARKSATAIHEVARRIHTRHPNNLLRRDCSVEQVEKKLAAILKRKRIPAPEQAAFLEQIDRNHAAMCASELWRKDDGQFVKGLEGWLAPMKERYLASPVVITANASERRYVL